MTEQQNTPEPETQASVAAPSAAEQRPHTRSPLPALGLALLALIGAGGVGLFAWQQQQALTSRVADLERSLSEQLAQRATLDALDQLQKALDALRQSFETQQRNLSQETTQRLDALRVDLATQQQALDTLRSLTGRDEWLWRLGEIERLLTAAQTRLRLMDDTATARLLLQEADRTAAPLGGEALPLREAIGQAVTSIQGPALDREGLALRLTQLAETLPTYPRNQPSAPAKASAPADDWWTRTKDWLGQWLHIERKTALSENNSDLAAAANKLLQARRALLTRETALAAGLVREVFELASRELDGNDPRALAALDELNDILSALGQPAPSLTDLTPAFTALRTLRQAHEAATSSGD